MGIFRLAQINNNMKAFNAFPHVPAKALERKNMIEEILKRLQKIDTILRYQVRIGKNDLVIMVKHHVPYDYRQYVPISLEMIDPNCEVPEWDLNTKADNIPEPAEQFKGNKRAAAGSPEGSMARKRTHDSYIDDWQIAEFLEAYINGTATTPKYGDSNWLDGEASTEYSSEQSNTTYNVDEVHESSNHDIDTDNI